MQSSRLLAPLAAAMLLFTVVQAAAQQAPFPLQHGEAVVTCSSGYDISNRYKNNYVVGVIDLRNPPADRVGDNWAAPMYHGPGDSWKSSTLGQVFGVTLDDVGNIYVTATTSYVDVTYDLKARYRFGAGGPGGVYRIDGTTGAVSLFATLPNTGPALGNIAFDEAHRQLLVTNFEDGKIYRLDMQGQVTGTHDPRNPDDGRPGFAPRGERPWGIAVHNGRAYYSVWWEEVASMRNKRAPGNELRSVAIASDGSFDAASDRNELWLPPLTPETGYSNPVATINFADDGRMLLAERSMFADTIPDAHSSRILEYTGGVGGSWIGPKVFPIGYYFGVGEHQNCAGGADYMYRSYDPLAKTYSGCDSVIWGTGDALKYPGANPDSTMDALYGIASAPVTGITPEEIASKSFMVDFDGDLMNTPKTGIGSIKIFRRCTSVPPPPPPPDTVRASDTVRICLGDRAILAAPAGVSYTWSPTTGLSCDNCREPVASPGASTVYIATVRDAGGGISIDTFTVIVTPKLPVAIIPGTQTDVGERLIRVPVYIIDRGAPFLTRCAFTVRYDSTVLWPRHHPPSAIDSLVRGTAAEGWSGSVTMAAPGALRIELVATGSAQPLHGGDILLYLDFIPLLSEKKVSTVIVEAIVTEGGECLDVRGDSVDVRTDFCGSRTRLITSSGADFTLDVNDPNPAASTTAIGFSLGLDAHAKLTLSDASGHLVATLLDRHLDAGRHEVTLDLKGLSSGIYYYRLDCGTWSETRRMIVVK